MLDTAHVRFFEPHEFYRNGENWWPRMSPRALILLDITRLQHGGKIELSGHERAIGRRDGHANTSQHNFDRHGEVRAIDVFPSGIYTRDDANRFYELAESIGWQGIGFYPHWTGGPGFHLDVRPDRDPGYPATWGEVVINSKRTRVSIRDAIEVMP